MNLDIQFLTTFFISLLRTMDLRSERAVRAIAEFLDLGLCWNDPLFNSCWVDIVTYRRPTI